MMKILRVGLAGAFLFLLVACASLGLAPAQSFDDRVAYANGTLTAVTNTTVTASQHRRITLEETKEARELIGNARFFLDTAQRSGDAPEGQQNLALAIAVLENLQLYLNERSKQ
jgi:anti-sigma factor ChrR (cupin superfamily)